MAERTCFIVEDDVKCEGITGVPGTARGMCSKHYTRELRRERDAGYKPRFIVADDEARFWSKVRKDGPVPSHAPALGPCWVWTTGLNHDGYGSFSYRKDGRTVNIGAHRWLMGHLRGEPLGPGEEACHHCDNPPCVNPGHLYVGTHADNMADHYERGRHWQAKVTHCPQGHPYDGHNLIVLKGGKRRCRECQNERARRNRTHCKNGHELSGDNVIPCKGGRRKCRTCETARAAATSVNMTALWAERRAT